MSYDLYLFRKDGVKKPLSLAETKAKLEESFPRVKMDEENGLAVGWEILRGNFSDGWEFYYQGDERGYYSAGCSYGVWKEMGQEFLELVKKVAICLDLKIQDPQFGEELVEPEDFSTPNDGAEIKFKHVQNLINEFPFIQPVEAKYFILFFIAAAEPSTGIYKTLVLKENGGVIGGKVEKGESLKQVLDREIPALTGSKAFRLTSVQHNYDKAFDKKGNELRRDAVTVFVPYFEPDKVKTKYPMKWI